MKSEELSVPDFIAEAGESVVASRRSEREVMRRDVYVTDCFCGDGVVRSVGFGEVVGRGASNRIALSRQGVCVNELKPIPITIRP